MRVLFGLIVLAIPIAGCGRTSTQDPPPAKEVAQKEIPPDPVGEGTAASATEITLHVEGMV